MSFYSWQFSFISSISWEEEDFAVSHGEKGRGAPLCPLAAALRTSACALLTPHGSGSTRWATDEKREHSHINLVLAEAGWSKHCLKYIFLIYPGSWFWNSWSAQPGDQRHKPRASGVRSAVQCQLPYLVQSLCNKCGWASCLPPGSLHCRIIWRCSCKYSGHDSGGPRSWGGCCTVKNVTNTCLFIVLRIYNFLSNTSKRCLEYRKSFFFKKSLLILIS